MKLNEYLKNNNISLSSAAKALGVSYEIVRRYCNGMSIPRRELLLKICEWSGGKVQPSDFYAETKTKQED
jgi:transcriptional regulator with XRE-family HTH domain